ILEIRPGRFASVKTLKTTRGLPSTQNAGRRSGLEDQRHRARVYDRVALTRSPRSASASSWCKKSVGVARIDDYRCRRPLSSYAPGKKTFGQARRLRGYWRSMASLPRGAPRDLAHSCTAMANMSLCFFVIIVALQLHPLRPP